MLKGLALVLSATAAKALADSYYAAFLVLFFGLFLEALVEEITKKLQ